eukprot:CAMPEP_0119312736 /NCGR_PEP_ID=MMETSP1333-20130426/26980_1 /TAXON_ID=418940 /ORGANISM="Scyphosphaera apsteinii, Strain RCC1455" /LENGTH=118 /DNA_ID=CAMNT_0007317395 /DNA_START=121 /DNA_END=478 /DNA_ORIENTATION=-
MFDETTAICTAARRSNRLSSAPRTQYYPVSQYAPRDIEGGPKVTMAVQERGGARPKSSYPNDELQAPSTCERAMRAFEATNDGQGSLDVDQPNRVGKRGRPRRSFRDDMETLDRRRIV